MGTEKAGPKHTRDWGPPLILELIKPLMYLKVLDDVNEMIFREYLHPRRPEEEVAAIPKSLFPDASCILSDEEWGSCCEEIRRVQGENMDKYAVEIDPDKVEKEKVGSKGGKPTSDPNVNIPLDPDKGSEPFEREETREKK